LSINNPDEYFQPLYNKWDMSRPISYEFDESIPLATRQKIRTAIAMWENKTCIRFSENGYNIDRIEFFDGGGCSSFVGKTGGTQGISISRGCDNIGIISHEIGHALGIFHEQARPDQSDHIFINYRNIPLSRWNNFQPMRKHQIDTHNLPYDTGSVMHYGPYGFASDPYIPTITTKNRFQQNTIGQREGPSFLDFEAINIAYGCNNHCPRTFCEHGGYTNPNDCNSCLCPNGFGGQRCETIQHLNCGSLIKIIIIICRPIRIILSPVWNEVKYITSPFYPEFSIQGQECAWLIESPFGTNVFFEFIDNFHIECHTTCDAAYVEIKNRADFRTTGYRFCCSKKPSEIFKSEANKMVLIYRSGRGNKGFKARIWSNAPPKTSKFAVDSCNCGEWSEWTTLCSQQCGGCGKRSRIRYCSRQDCRTEDKRTCNYDACPPGTNFLINNGEFHILWKGCCIGLFRFNTECSALADGENPFLAFLKSFLTSQNPKDKEITDN
uniref:Zinc metalloproteinase n=1 Tax=Dracunculus medinensis TaxID=318479 RepID=A0A0N4U9R3_DRAME